MTHAIARSEKRPRGSQSGSLEPLAVILNWRVALLRLRRERYCPGSPRLFAEGVPQPLNPQYWGRDRLA
jgi:hypothetical protein